MKTKLGRWNSNRDLIIGVLLSVSVVTVGAYLNFVTPYDPYRVTLPSTTAFILWLVFYLPLALFTVKADWNIEDFGFSINYRANFASIIVLALVAPITMNLQVPWRSALIEAFARTGEEVFFRGFLFLLVFRVFSEKARPGMWAVLISALVFALVHTQAFQASYFENVSMSRSFLIVQRLFNIFLIGALFALIRHWTQSILPGVIAHCLMNGGLVTLPFCLAIFAGLVFWAHKRGENVLSGITSNKGTG